MLSVKKINESFSEISGPFNLLKNIYDFLKVERPGAYFETLVQKGWKSPYDYYSKIKDNKLYVMNGHLQLLSRFGIDNIDKTITEFDKCEVYDFKIDLPFEPYDYQINAVRDCLLNPKQLSKMCTGSGKSLTISMIAEFMFRKNKKGLILVPNINLLTQFKNDIMEYKLQDLYDNTNTIGGGNSNRDFNSALTISTWQSLIDYKDKVKNIDYIIIDECHRFASEETSAIINASTNAKYKWGFTGTIPEDPTMKMQLLGLLGMPKTYITTRQLIDRGLGTPIIINSIFLNYDLDAVEDFTKCGKTFQNQLKFIKEYEPRKKFINTLINRLKGNSLVLFSHTEHGKEMFINYMKLKFPEVEVQNKDITGKKSFEFQKQYGVFFLNGEDNAETREKTRNIMEEFDNAVLFSNYSILSTGVNLKKLHNMVFAAPLKSYTSITQSIGRGVRLHESKKEFNVYDIIDNFKPFVKQYNHRLKTSYNSEEHPVNTININLINENLEKF